MQVGTIREIWRYPVKSMQGERLDSVEVAARGLPGDRAWAARDEVRGGIRGGKKIAGLMRCAARYLEPPPAEGSVAAEIELPDGARVLSNAPDAAKRVSEAIGHPVTLWPLLPAEALEHYRRGAPSHDDFEKELRAIFGRAPDEPLPDLSVLPPEVLEYESPPGTYFDAFPLLLLTTASLERLGAAAPSSQFDVRRFRPNFLIETPEPGGAGTDFVEMGWRDRELRIGGLRVHVAVECPRCVMTTRPLADLPRDPNVMRTLVRDAGGNLGVYATVTDPGRVRLGDPVELLEQGERRSA